MTTISLPQWKVDRAKPGLRASATQFETMELCNRKWWLANVRRLKTFSTDGQVFGTVLHSVAQRYAEADDLGRDKKTGKAVELFPPGWQVAESRFGKPSEGSVDNVEADLIKRLIASAIESGALERPLGRSVEMNFTVPIEGTDVQVIGFIDLFTRDCVQDHKSTKSMRWAKTPEGLKKSIQMMLYGKVAVEMAKKRGEPPPEKITLRHNVFCKDPGDARVRKVEAVVTAGEVEEFWRTVIVPMAIRMVILRQRTEKWHEIPDPASVEKACNAFGGCPFRSICAGREDENGYELRLDRFSNLGYAKLDTPGEVPVTPSIPQPEKGSIMDFTARLAQKKAIGAAVGAPPAGAGSIQVNPAPQAPAAVAAAAGAAAPVAAPAAAAAAPAPAVIKPRLTLGQPPVVAPAAAAPAQAPVSAAVSQMSAPTAAPWYNPGCGACSGNQAPGFNSQGQPCRICAAKAAASGKKGPEGYEIVHDGGLIIVVEKGGGFEGTFPNQAAPAAIAQDERVQVAPTAAPPAPAPAAPAPSPIAQAAAASTIEPAPAGGETEAEKGKRGRPRKSFTLLINCAPIKGVSPGTTGRKVIYLTDTLVEVASALEKTGMFGSDTFWDANAFTRRDAITKNAEAIAAEFGTDLVCVTGLGTGQSDMRALVDAIRPYAGMEIVGTEG